MNINQINEKRHDRRQFLGLAGLGAAGVFLAGMPTPSEAASFAVTRSAAEWKRMLGSKRYAILRQGGTEPAYSSPLLKEHRSGTFVCAGCAQDLFLSATKFDSGTGWPSFYRPVSGSVLTKTDRSFGMIRKEVLCTRCGGHLGHVFDDGPKPTGLRYCINGLALKFKPS